MNEEKYVEPNFVYWFAVMPYVDPSSFIKEWNGQNRKEKNGKELTISLLFGCFERKGMEWKIILFGS